MSRHQFKISRKFMTSAALAPILVATLAFVSIQPVHAAPDSRSAISLRAKYAALTDTLKNNQFNRPIAVESNEMPNRLQGEVYALVDHPIADVNAALSKPASWCDVLILHLNTKQCRVTQNKDVPMLAVSIGKKHDQPLEQAYRVDFIFNAAQSTPEYLDVKLNADNGPLGTSDYRIVLEATSVAEGKTFLHLTYSYGYSFASKVAMQGYLATIGSNKVGFTKGQGDYIGGIRGLVERNTMRYYLAIDSYLDAREAAPAQRFEKAIESWFAATERYPRQLHELDRNSYLTMKREEYRRQQSGQ
ncbi:MAG: hypothetical protein H7315_09360 [Herminiimonas sp.]|nr:hypothetical protein [Herminiimonas sp.]